MDRVLVYGLKDPVGGVEKVVLSYARQMTRDYDISFDFVLFTGEFSLENEILEMGCRVWYAPSRKSDYSGYQKFMDRLFAENRYVAVWGNYSGLTNIDLLVLAKKYGVSVRVAHSHVSRLYWGSPIMKYVVHVLHYGNRLRLPSYATHYFACSEVSRDFMFPKKLRQRTDLIHNAIDTDVFHPDAAAGQMVRRELGLSEDALVVGHVARMCEVKNQKFLLEVMAKLLARRPEARLLFVGEGELWDELKTKTRELQIRDKVIFTGNRSDVARLLQAMDVFVLTSLSEGLSLSSVEAQACGVPCVLPTAVSPETDITGGVRFVPLEAGAEHWATAIEEMAGARIDDPAQKLAAKGYDMGSAAQKLYYEFVGERHEDRNPDV